MGCSSSKQVQATAPAAYRPPPSSFAVFDIHAIEEPWLNKLENVVENHEKPSHVPAPLLEKLDTFEKEGPRTWDEVSKALEEDLKKPTIVSSPSPKPGPFLALPAPPPKEKDNGLAIRTVADLDKKPDKRPDEVDEMKKIKLRKTELTRTESTRDELPNSVPSGLDSGFRSVKVNPFIMKDRMEREKEGKEAAFDKIMKAKRDPLSDFQEICPPGGSQLVVIYTTSLGGVRRTFEDCNRVRMIFETHRVVFDERDVSLHGEFLSELKELVGSTGDGVGSGTVPVPRVFVKGRYLGGVDEVVELNEAGRLGRILSVARVERGAGWQGCEGCGGARFVPCWECGGSCKVVVGGNKERCPKCNENGLAHCPRCH